MLGVLDPVATKVGPGTLGSDPGALRSDLEALRLDLSCASPLYLAYHSKALRASRKVQRSLVFKFVGPLLLCDAAARGSLSVQYRHQRPAISRPGRLERGQAGWLQG
jgi:hypothetical protein